MKKKKENMWKCFRFYSALLVVVPGLFFTVSCTKQIVQSEPAVVEEVVATEEPAAADLQQDQIAEQASKEADVQKDETDVQQMFPNEDIYFDFESSALEDIARNVLSRKAEWLLMNPDASIIIEGHCDERGTSAYNIALGDRRAESAKSYLVDLGIDATQLSKISYGEERPVAMGKDEEAWAENRRAHFVLE